MRNILLLLTLSVVTLNSIGCSYALVPATNDPSKKIDQAYQMWELGRWIPAEGLGRQALDISIKKGDLVGQANAHRYLGNFYKGRLYRKHRDWFAEGGKYDPTTELSRSHFQRAVDIWERMDDAWGVATDIFNIGTTYSIDGNKEKACEYYAKAINIYQSPKSVFKGVYHPWNKSFKDFPSMVKAFSGKEGCEEVL